MKRITFSFILLLSCLAVKPQMARWVMQPVYDKIYMASGAPLVLSEALGTTDLWNMEGSKVGATTGDVYPFREGQAVTMKKGTSVITGFYKSNGEFVSVGKNLSSSSNVVVCPYPYFSDGYLLVKAGSRYHFLNADGEDMHFSSFEQMYPFSGGYAVCMTYESVEKKKNPYYFCLTTDNQPVMFYLKDKVVDSEDVKYLSSLNDEGIGIAVVKKKVYSYSKGSQILSPLFIDENEMDEKKQVALFADLEESLFSTADSVVLRARSGKTNIVKLVFDKIGKPVRFYLGGRIVNFKSDVMARPVYETQLGKVQGNGKFGLTYKGKLALPPQFEDVGFCVNNYAVVRSGGKWGMLVIDDDLNFRLQMNKGNDIPFRHQKFETTVRLDLPPVISADKCRFDIDSKFGCTIDKLSCETRNTESGNYVQYNCVLTIPPSLPDVITEISYPVLITYDGLEYPAYPFKVKAWHYKYINVDLYDEETTIEKGNVAFTIIISAEKNPGESDYPFEVEIHTDSLQTDLEKISETRYKCRLFSLAEGVNNVTINVVEKGCPPAVFPFEITYTKPARRSSKKEQVVIEKKTKARPKEEVPHLEI